MSNRVRGNMVKDAKWEPITNDSARMRVPSGWLYRVVTMTETSEVIDVAVVFVPYGPMPGQWRGQEDD